MKYLAVIERTGTGYSAFVPDLFGCVATGSTLDEVRKEIQEAVEFHLEGLQEEHLTPPAPDAEALFVEVARV